MLGIVIYHILCHCISGQLSSYHDINGHFNHPVFYKSLMVLDFVEVLGALGNAIFILLSGYFMCSADKRIDLIKISKKLLTQLAFASVILMVGSQIVRQVLTEKYVPTLDNGIFNGSSWYVGYYFLVIVIAGLFLNRFLGSLDKTRYLTFLAVTFGLIQFSWSGSSVLGGTIGDGRTVGTGIFLFALGGFIRKYNPLEHVRTWVIWTTIVIMLAIVGLSYYNIVMRGIDECNKKGSPFSQPLPGYSNYSIVIMILCVAIFELFRRLPEFKGRIVNFLGAATFMVYLLHDNSFFYNLWDIQDWIGMLYNDKLAFIRTYLIWAIGVFVLGTLAYALYVGIAKLFKSSGWKKLTMKTANDLK